MNKGKGIMDRRHPIHQTQMSEMDRERIWNHPHNDHWLHLVSGNVSSMVPTDNIASTGGNSVAYFNPTLISNGVQVTNVSSEFPRYLAANTGTPRDAYIPSGGSITQLQPHPVQYGFSYNQHALRDLRSNADPIVIYERETYKRKHPANFMLPEREHRNRFYGAASSSNATTSTGTLQENPILDSQCWTREAFSFAHSYRNNNASSSGEGSQRNVRIRLGNPSYMDNISSGISSNSNFSYHDHSIASALGDNMEGQWNYTPASVHPNTRASSGSFNYEINQSYVANQGTNNMAIDGGYSSTLPMLRGPSRQSFLLGPNSYGQRATATYRANPSYPTVGLVSTSEDVRLQRLESAAPSRYSTPLSIVGQSNERNGRPRNRHNRFHSFSDDTARIRGIAEGVSMMDDYDPMHYFDQHHEMRLDVDNMSYEDLLALEERIGSVNTGLSKDAITRCLKQTIYCLPDQIQDDGEEENCPICLESYKDRETVGRLKCKHIFHCRCITKWLLMKNICPICKSCALEDTSKTT